MEDGGASTSSSGGGGGGGLPPGKGGGNNNNGNNGGGRGGQTVETTDAIGDDAWMNTMFLVVVLAYLFSYFNTKCIC